MPYVSFYTSGTSETSTSGAVEICNIALSKIGAKTITSLDADSCKEDRLCKLFYTRFRNELLMKYQWNFAKRAVPLNRTDLYETTTGYDDYLTITNVATSNPVTITTTNTYEAGQTILISGVVGTTELNDLVFEIAEANTATFSLAGVDGGKYGTYVSGGTVIRAEAMTDYTDGYTYDLPSDCLRPIALDSGTNYEIFEDRLLTNEDAPVLIYIALVTDTDKMGELYKECLIAKLSAELCMPLLGSKEGINMRAGMERIYRQALNEAMRVEVSSIKRDYSYQDPWITARN